MVWLKKKTVSLCLQFFFKCEHKDTTGQAICFICSVVQRTYFYWRSLIIKENSHKSLSLPFGCNLWFCWDNLAAVIMVLLWKTQRRWVHETSRHKATSLSVLGIFFVLFRFSKHAELAHSVGATFMNHSTDREVLQTISSTEYTKTAMAESFPHIQTKEVNAALYWIRTI